jgi:hypothetical protein
VSQCTKVVSQWLVSIFNMESSQLIVPFKGSIVVDDGAVNRFFRLPIGKKIIVYKQRASEETYNQFYDTIGKSNAPKFYEEEKWFAGAGRDETTDNWMKGWLLFTVSSFLCPTTCEQLCVKAYRSIHDVASFKNYNWCDLVVKQLMKGIKNLKDGKSKSDDERNKNFEGWQVKICVRVSHVPYGQLPFLFCMIIFCLVS